MSSWELLRTFFPWGDFPVKKTPIFVRESTRTLAWPRVSTYLSRIPITTLIFVGLLYFVLMRIVNPPFAMVCVDGLLLVIGPPLLLLPSLLLWVLPLGFVLSPLIARERHHGIWEILRVTPYSTEDILVGKVRGALWILRGLLSRLAALQAQVIAAILLGLGFMEFLSLVQEWPGDLSSMERSALCMGMLLLLLILFVVFFLDRAQQLTLMIVAALAVSTPLSSTHTALTRAITAVFLTWAIDVGVAITLLILQPAGAIQDFGFSVAAIIMLGPIAGYTIELQPLQIALFIAVTFVIREMVIRVLWRAALHGADKLL